MKKIMVCMVAGLVGMVAAAAGNAGPVQDKEKEAAIKVKFVQTGGFAGVNRTADIDSSKLPAKEAAELQKLIEQSQFFKQPAKFPPSKGADFFEYQITVEMKGRRHSVKVDDSQAPKTLKPLIAWLAKRAKEAKRDR